MLQQIWEEACNSSTWADPDQELCACRAGWFLSELDTEHKCPYHNDGQPSRAWGTAEDWEAYETKKAFVMPTVEMPEAPTTTSDELDEIPF